MAEIIRMDIDGYQKLLDQLKIKLPTSLDRLAAATIAKTATTARLKEQSRAMPKLHMGEEQQSTVGKDNHLETREFTVKTRQGWASTTRKNKDGDPWALARFSWEKARTTKTKKAAAYTSHLANLWGKNTKPYSNSSPPVGNPAKTMHWQKGIVRHARYFWSIVESVMRDSITEGIRKAEQDEKTRPDGVLK